LSNHASHIIVSYPSKKTDLLYRASDGCGLGCRMECRIFDGEDPNPALLKTRNYIDESYALGALREIAHRDAGGSASFVERDGETALVRPNGSVISTARN